MIESHGTWNSWRSFLFYYSLIALPDEKAVDRSTRQVKICELRSKIAYQQYSLAECVIRSEKFAGIFKLDIAYSTYPYVIVIINQGNLDIV